MKVKSIVYGLIIFLVVVAGAVLLSNPSKEPVVETQTHRGTLVVGAVGGGKENFLADAEIADILAEEYGIELVNVSWSNGRINDAALAEDSEHAYDFVFFSDQRYYEQYLAANNKTYKRLNTDSGYIALNTPVVVYSWAEVADALRAKGIVQKRDGVYYITDMPQLLQAIGSKAKWSDMGLPQIYGPVNIASVDPVTSSPGATYYGLLASILHGGDINRGDISGVLTQLQDFYATSGYMNNTPADLFDLYLRTGMGAKPMIVDYEKSIVDWAISNPEAYKQLQNKIVLLYPEPTIWNSHCLIAFTENGQTFLRALKENARIQEIAFTRYGFRAGLTTSYKDISFAAGEESLAIQGIPAEVLSVVPGLRMESYDKIIEALKQSQ